VTEKCCKTCKWWTDAYMNTTVTPPRMIGRCAAPVPDCVLIPDDYGQHGVEDSDRWPMTPDEGTDCPCFERRDDDGKP